MTDRDGVFDAMRKALAELLPALEAERKAVAEFLDHHQDRAKRDEYRTAMYVHRANRELAESRARAVLEKAAVSV